MEEPNWKPSIPRQRRWGGCRAYKHFRLDMTCVAYPDRIPLIIVSAEVDHLVVRPHQVGESVWELNDQPTGLSARLIAAARVRGETWATAPVPVPQQG